MRLCFFNEGRFGLVKGDRVYDVTAALSELPTSGYPYPRHDVLIEKLPQLRGVIEAAAIGDGVSIESVKFHSPVANPGKIFAAPVNYQKHLQEAIDEPETFSRAHVRKIQETGLFLKATSSIIGPSHPVLIRHSDRRTDHEVELAVIIGKPCLAVTAANAMDYIAGYSIGLDITIRGPEERSMRKSLDTYTVLGPWVVTADEIPDPAALDLALDVNGEPRQRANTRDLILDIPALLVFASSFYTLMPGDIPALLVFASSFYTLMPGDILLTGTPEGVGPIMPGDVMDARIEHVGAMRVAVEAAAGAA